MVSIVTGRHQGIEGIKEGTGASDGFIEAIDPEITPERKVELEERVAHGLAQPAQLGGIRGQAG